MQERYQKLEAKIEKLARCLELMESSLMDLKEKIDTRSEIDKVESIVLRLAKTFTCRKIK